MLKYLTEHSVLGSLLNEVNEEGDNALMMAAGAGQVDCVKYLTEHSESGSLLTQVNRKGDNALMVAAGAGQVDCVKYLTEHSESGSLLTQVNRKGDNALMVAAGAGQVDCVKYLTEHSVLGSLLNEVNKEGDNALMVAARAGQVDCVKYLTEHSVLGSLLNEVNKEGDNALMVAARAGQVDCVKYLTEHSVLGSLLNEVNKEGDNALMVAARAGQVDCVKYLTEHSVSGLLLNQVNKEGQTALIMAARRLDDDHALCMKFLVDAGADVNVHDRSGLTALMYALGKYETESFKFIIEQMSVSALNQANNDGKTALMMATSRAPDDHGLSVKCLVEAGADVNVHDRYGRTALMYALETNRMEIVKFLTVQMSFSALNQVNNDGKTALMMAASCYADEYGLIVKCLVEAGANVNLHDRYERTALMLAVQRPSYLKSMKNDTSRVQSLIKGRADLSLQDNSGRNALMIAIEGNHSIAILKLLTDNMSLSNINQVNKKGQTALMFAASNHDHKDAICLLIAAGADLNVTDTELGYTALMCAIHERNDMAATLLLEKGAHVNIVARDLQTPLSLIRSNGEMMITELLSRGLDPALSCRDQGILHTMVAEVKDSVVRELVMNGFPPVDIKWNVSRRGFGSYITDPSQTTTMSPLALALTYMHHNIARYLIVNRFFTRYDSVHLCGNQELRQSLQLQIQQPRESSRFARARTYCLGILDLLSARPLSLHDLCLVTISSALSQYLVRDPQDIPPGDSRWMCQPTFKERVQLLDIPPALKRQLLHQTSYSCIPCESWGDISLE